ncbi:hypothetical protein T12_115, partial [Trichinella patagoniensis]
LDTPRSILRSNRKRPECNGNLWASLPRGPKSPWPVFGTHRTFLASVGAPWLSVSVRFARHTCGRPDTTRPPPSSSVARSSVAGVYPGFTGTQNGHRTCYCAWPQGHRFSVPLERVADQRHGRRWLAYVAKDRSRPPGTPLSRPSTGTGGPGLRMSGSDGAT